MLLEATVDRAVITADPEDLAFVTLRLVDEDGVLHVTRDREGEVQVEGPAVLQALGSANPATEEGFSGTRSTTFEGRALAIVRPRGAGRAVCGPRRRDARGSSSKWMPAA